MSTATSLRAYATVTGTSARFVAPGGRVEPLTATDGEDIRNTVLRKAADEARRAGAPLELVTSGDRGDHRLIVDIDGYLHAVESAPIAHHAALDVSTDTESSSSAPIAAVAPAPIPVADPPPAEIRLVPGRPVPARNERRSFIETSTSRDDGYHPAGFRGLLYRAGLVTGPGRAEGERIAQERMVSRQWAGCRTIAVANGKGGVGKTMTTAMLAAVFARYGGGSVLAWDNNDTRGTLGWRTEQGTYDTTIRDLLPAASALLGPAASISDIARFVHHQADDRYDVLRSNPELLAAHQRIDQPEFDLLMQVAAHYYRMVIFDSGNDESADRWLRMIDSSFQLVVPTLAAPESAESASLLLEALRDRDEHSAALATNAVVVVTQSEPTTRGQVSRIADGFEGVVRAVETIPFDPAMKSGPLRFDTLRPATRRAWLKTAASAAAAL